MDRAKAQIDGVIAVFFGAFCNEHAPADVEVVPPLFVPGGIVSKRAGGVTDVWSVEAFLAPRRELLKSGALRDFVERETSERTEIAGGLAQRRSTYEKSGTWNGAPYAGRGVKLFQLVETPAGWKILSIAWEDEV